DTPKIIDKTLADILARQHGDGGFGMWSDSTDSSPWMSAYALWALRQAQTRGAGIPPKVIEHGRDYLRRYLESELSDPLYWPTAAFFVDVLAELGAADARDRSRLYRERQKLPLFARALLLHALSISKQKRDL